MNRKFSPSEILERLHAIDGLVEDGYALAEALSMAGVDHETYARWRSEYGGLLRLLDWPGRTRTRGAKTARKTGRQGRTLH